MLSGIECAPTKANCRDFQKGKCKRGASCKYGHAVPNEMETVKDNSNPRKDNGHRRIRSSTSAKKKKIIERRYFGSVVLR